MSVEFSVPLSQIAEALNLTEVYVAENYKEKELVRKVTVVVALDLSCGNTNNSEYESKYTTKFTIKVNARTISADATNFNNFAKSTVTHEFGHVFWLCG